MVTDIPLWQLFTHLCNLHIPQPTLSNTLTRNQPLLQPYPNPHCPEPQPIRTPAGTNQTPSLLEVLRPLSRSASLLYDVCSVVTSSSYCRASIMCAVWRGVTSPPFYRVCSVVWCHIVCVQCVQYGEVSCCGVVSCRPYLSGDRRLYSTPRSC